MERNSGVCPTGGRGVVKHRILLTPWLSEKMHQGWRISAGQTVPLCSKVNNVQALRARAGALHREQVALLEALSRQAKAKRRSKKNAQIQRESVPVPHGDRRIILMRPGRQTEPSLARDVVHNLWRKRIIMEPKWPKKMIRLLPVERKMADAFAKRREADKATAQQIPSERLQGARPQGARPQGARPQGARPQGARPQGARPQGVCPSPARGGHHSKVRAATPRIPATTQPGPSTRRPAPSSAGRNQSQSRTAESLKQEEQFLRKLKAKQKRLVNIETQKLKQEEAALQRNFQIQRQQEASLARKKREEIKRRPQEKRKMQRACVDVKRQKSQAQKILKAEKIQDKKLVKEKAEIQRFEKGWLMFEEKQLQQRKRLLDQRAAEVEKMLQSETAEIRTHWQTLQKELQMEREKLRRDQEYLEEIKREQEELEAFEENEREMMELQEFEDREREIAELEEFEQQERLLQNEEICEQGGFPGFDPAVPVDLTQNYQPIPAVKYIPDDSTCKFPGL
ncbi:putative golgin subfamily A member 6-like protein 3 isoform X13 [Narcine bancroftii]|uniref:putative golgin subfamily A member 6-like protein 3 isoform X13 n=1 Tax=Narcine bancroftii TaxID=1343680 RepID=UPI00383189CD